MRTIVDIPKEDIERLDRLGEEREVSRAALVRQAIVKYLDEEKQKASGALLDKYFGFLKDDPDAFDGLDGVEYQRKIRGEWDDRDALYADWGSLSAEEFAERMRRYNAGEPI